MKKGKLILTTLICLSPILLGLTLYDRLPEMIPTHFDLAGNPNGWSSRGMAVFGLPAFMAVLNLVCHLAESRLRGEKGRRAAPEIMFLLTDWLCPVLSLLIVPMCLFEGMGMSVPVGRISMLVVAILFVVMGNYLPKCRPNPYMGIKLPWTYASEENWYKTHRFGGKVWVVCGLLLIPAGLFSWEWLLFPVIAAAAVLPVGYSWMEHRKGGPDREG